MILFNQSTNRFCTPTQVVSLFSTVVIPTVEHWNSSMVHTTTCLKRDYVAMKKHSRSGESSIRNIVFFVAAFWKRLSALPLRVGARWALLRFFSLCRAQCLFEFGNGIFQFFVFVAKTKDRGILGTCSRSRSQQARGNGKRILQSAAAI